MVNSANPAVRSEIWLVAGSIMGVLIALSVALMDRSTPPSHAAALNGASSVVAQVNGVDIRFEAFQKAIDAVNSERRSPLTTIEKRRVLDRLIDEELLFQYGLTSGVPQRDPVARNAIVQSVMASVRDMADDQAPTEAELRAHYETNANYFSNPPKIRASYVFVMAQPIRTADAARQRAERAMEAFADADAAADVVSTYHDGGARLPNALLPGDKLRDYVGGLLGERLLTMRAGDVAGPIEGERGFYALAVHQRVDGGKPPYAQVAEAVRDHWLRNSAERRLRELVQQLRYAADLSIAE